MRRILFVLGGRYLPGTITGETVSLHALCKRLCAEGFEPILVCQRDPPEATGGAPAPGGFDYAVLRLADPVAAMLEMIPTLRPDAVVIQGPQAAARTIEKVGALSRTLHICFGTTFYGYPAPSEDAARLLRYAVVSRYLEIFARAYLGCDVALLPPLLEPDDYRCRPSGDAILFVNPIAAKGVHLVAAIAARLPQRRFLVARSWVDRQGFSHVAIPLDNVEFVESTHDMRPIYARAKLVLMPTLIEEGWGRTVSEAQISGIPALVSDRGALPEVVGPGGLVFSLGEPVARWCAEIEALYDDAARYAALSRAAKAHAERTEIKPAVVVARFLDFLAT